MSPEVSQASPNNGASSGSRVSLACLPCRSRHVRCDAKKPECDRCREEGKQCNYAKSRRGGLDRAALAARRNQVAALATAATAAAVAAKKTFGGISPPRSAGDSGSAVHDGSDRSSSKSTPPATQQAKTSPIFYNTTSLTQHLSLSTQLFTPPDDCWSLDGSLSPLDLHSTDISRDPYIDIYYKCFQRYHPCVLPRKRLESFLKDPVKLVSLRTLIYVLRFIGSIYISATQPSSQAICRQLEEFLSNQIEQLNLQPPNPYTVQCHLLYSIGLYWSGQPVKARHHMDTAIQMALNTGMHLQEFAYEHGEGDPVLEECWRRTWWQIYIVDAYLAAIKKNTTFQTFAVQATTELPCEEAEYESENIPIPKTLDEFNSREFAPDHTFSSFAYLVGATNGMAEAMSRVIDLLNQPSDITMPNASSQKLLESVDAILDGWMLLLPESKKGIFSKSGDVDELMFQAFMAIHATTVGLHRPFSDCLFDPLECISSCSTPPLHRARQEPSEFKLIHTAKCVRAAEAQIRLLALPTRPCCHTPFVVCMLTTGTLSLLAACKYILKGPQLSVARDQIRMSIGCHKAMASVWTQAGSNLKEVQTIARKVLGIPTGAAAANKETPIESIHGTEAISSNENCDFNGASGDDEGLSSISLENMQTYWNYGDFQATPLNSLDVWGNFLPTD